MKKTYEKASIEIIRFQENEVITASKSDNDNTYSLFSTLFRFDDFFKS